MEICCPRCGNGNIKTHCRDRDCGWFCCTSCVPVRVRALVFDLKDGRFHQVIGYESS